MASINLSIEKISKSVVLPNNLEGHLIKGNFTGQRSPQFYSYTTKGILYIFEYDEQADEIKYEEKRLIPQEQASKKNQIYFADIFGTGTDVAIVKIRSGLNFYEIIDKKPKLIHTEKQFLDASGWNKDGATILFGRIFYDTGMLGVASLKGDTLGFYGIMKVPLRDDLPAVYPLQTDVSIMKTFLAKSPHELHIHDLTNRGREHLIARSSKGIGIFEFDQENLLRHILTLDCCRPTSNFEKLIFANITGSEMKDIVYISASGFYLYQFKNDSYNFIHHNSMFLPMRGFNKQHLDSILTKDSNGDGRDDIVLTGPFGLGIYSYNQYDNGLYNILDENSSSLDNKFMHLVAMERLGSNLFPSAFVGHGNNLSLLNLRLADPVPKDIKRDNLIEQRITSEVNYVKPKIVPKMKIKETILLRDQLDMKSFMQSIDTPTGKPKFMLPLVSLKAPLGRFELNYDSKSTTSGILGVGWDFGMSYIALNDRQSVFPEDHSYYLIYQGVPQILHKKFEDSTNDVQVYYVENNIDGKENDIKLKYMLKNEMWELDISGNKQYFGNTKDNKNANAIRWSIGWKNYRGPNTDAKSAIRIATEWYLCVEVRKKGKEIVNYYYEVTEEKIPGSYLKYTREINLKSIHDDENNSLNFKYGLKTESEYVLPEIIGENGIIQPYPVQTKYLQSYTLITEEYEQDIQLDYKITDDIRFLSAVKQVADFSDQPVLRFAYKQNGDRWMITSLDLPRGITIKYTYSELHLPKKKETIKNYEADKSAKIMHGEDFIVISHTSEKKDKLIVAVFDSDMTKKLMTASVVTKDIKDHTPAIGHDFFAITVYHDERKEVHIFQKTDKNVWPNKPQSFSYSIKTPTRFGGDFLVTSEGSKITVLENNEKNASWRSVATYTASASSLYIAVTHNKFVTYDNRNLYLGYKEPLGTWHYVKLKEIKGIISTAEYTLRSFNIEDVMKNDIDGLFKRVSLQFVNNIVVLYSWRINNWRMYTDIYTFVLDKNRSVALYQSYNIEKDDLRTFSKDSQPNNGTIFTYAYHQVGNLFEVFCKSFRGKGKDEIEKERKKKYEQYPEQTHEVDKNVNDYIQEIKTNITRIVKRNFLLDMQKYLVDLRYNTFQTNGNYYNFVGDSWELQPKQEEPKFLNIGMYFVLKQNAERVNLYRKRKNRDEYVLDMKVKRIQEIFVKYPSFISYTNRDNTTEVITFTADGKNIEESIRIPSNGVRPIWSSDNILITEERHSKNKNCSTFAFRSLKKLRKEFVINTLSISYDQDHIRQMGYSYDGNSTIELGDNIFYKKSIIFPGNNKLKFGYTENHLDIEKGGEVYQIIYNGRGENLKKLMKDDRDEKELQQKIKDDAELFVNTTLSDKKEELEIAQFFPFKIVDEEVSYIGFEDYEKNDSRWKYGPRSINRKSFALTGENILRLYGTTLEGSFMPKNQNLTLVASTWIHPHGRKFEVGQYSPYFKASMTDPKGNEFHATISEVKHQLGDWFYLETIINYPYIRAMLANLESNNINNDNANMNKIGLIIRISSGLNMTLDVDHVRLSPIDVDFTANIYKNKRISEKIHNNGLISRHIHNVIHEDIGHINTYGVLDSLQIKSKTSLFNFTTAPSNILIEPEYGFYEEFSGSSFEGLWTIHDSSNWAVAPGQLAHGGNKYDVIALNSADLMHSSFGIRFKYDLSLDSGIKISDLFEISTSAKQARLSILGVKHDVPRNGEILWVMEEDRCFLWIDGNPYTDAFMTHSAPLELLNIAVKGSTIIYEVMVMKNPRIRVTYFNALGEKIQDVLLESKSTAIVQGFLYDPLGRQSLTTEPVRVSHNSSILNYYRDFVRNGNPNKANSVWSSGKLEGMINEYNTKNKGYGYGGKIYDDNSLEEKICEGFPGKEFTINARFSRKYSSDTSIPYLRLVYPKRRGYSYNVEYSTDGEVQFISVLNSKEHLVAKYVHIPEAKDHLTTYEVDDEGRLLKMYPPLYHDKAKTLLNVDVNNYKHNVSSALIDVMSYDSKGNLLSRETPDVKRMEYVYKNDLVRFISHYNEGGKVDKVLYFEYDSQDRLLESGRLNQTYNKAELESILKNKEQLPGNIIYQQFSYGSFLNEPVLRNTIKRSITMNGDEPLVEETVMDLNDNIASKRIILPLPTLEKPMIIEIKNKYVLGKISEIHYPHEINGNPLRITYEYNKLGQIVAIGTPEDSRKFATFEYNAAGMVTSEKHLPDTEVKFEREFSYNEPHYLTRIKDKYFTEIISYTDNSYGGRIFGDGTITKTEYLATWHEYANERELKLDERSFISSTVSERTSEICFQKLKENGYIDETGHQTKVFHTVAESNFPIACSKGTSGRYIAQTLGSKGFPRQFGHSYDYGNHKEMTKAKYFVGESVEAPLQIETFDNIANITTKQAIEIWKSLQDKGYIMENKDTVASKHIHGKKGRSITRSELFSDLRTINKDYGMYSSLISKILLETYAGDKTITMPGLESSFSQWAYPKSIPKSVIRDIWKMLGDKKYLHEPLTTEFKESMQKFSNSTVRAIVGKLIKHFATQLGEAEFDVESYEIDSNGNHKHYYTGFDRYEMDYNENNNQIKTVKKKSFAKVSKEKRYGMKHDYNGNAIQALHKDILHMEYEPVLNRIATMKKVDGTYISFRYDALGNRASKRVMKANGELIREIQYIRDTKNRPLIEREIINVGKDVPLVEITTAYVYGPRGLLGFFRSGEFFSVISDHEGSTRLVVQGGRVVAAYDYLPYGGMMRSYDPEGLGVRYRYNGQEWDSELGLYNFRARLYDPDIGRFFQVDPRSQYPSPYKFAGNSPVSLIDPDGEFAIIGLIFAIIGAVVGAYLGGAAANKSFNPLKWDFRKTSTWLGLIGGAITGALLPYGFVGSIATLTTAGLSTAYAIAVVGGLGVAGSYFSIAASQGDFNPGNWDWKSPELWNSLFQGFAMGSGAIGGAKGNIEFYQKLSAVGKVIFVSGSAVSGIGLFVMNGFKVNWDIKNPALWTGTIQAVLGASEIPMFLKGSTKFLSRNMLKILKNEKNRNFFKNLFIHGGKLTGAAGVVAVSIYLHGDDATGGTWDFKKLSTYDGILTGSTSGKSYLGLGKKGWDKIQNHRELKGRLKLQKRLDSKAQFAADIYKKILPDILIDGELSAKIKQGIENGVFPDLKIAAQRQSDLFTVTVSADGAHGIIVYSNGDGSSLSMIVNEQSNKNVPGKPITFAGDSRTDYVLDNAIISKQNDIKIANKNDFEKTTLPEITKLMTEADKSFPFQLDDSVKEFRLKKIKRLKDAIKEKGTLDINDISEVVIKPYKLINEANFDVKRKIIDDIATLTKGELSAKLDLLSELKIPVNDKKNMNEINSKVEFAKTTREFNLKEIDTSINKVVSAMKKSEANFMSNEKITNSINTWSNKLADWNPTNAAELHALNAHVNVPNQFKIFYEGKYYNKKYYRGDKGELLATYGIKKGTDTYERCDRCLVPVNGLSNNVPDSDWLNQMDNLRNKMKDLTVHKINLIFLHAPIEFVETQTSRRKRSVKLYPTADIDHNSGYMTEEPTSGFISNTSWFRNPLQFISKFADKFFTTGSPIYSESFLPPRFNTISDQKAFKNADDFKNSAHVDTAGLELNGTLMLADVLIRKFTEQKFVNTSSTMDVMKAQVASMNLIEKIEQVLDDDYGICINEFIDIPALQSEIYNSFYTENYKDIPELLRMQLDSVFAELMMDDKDARIFEILQQVL